MYLLKSVHGRNRLYVTVVVLAWRFIVHIRVFVKNCHSFRSRLCRVPLISQYQARDGRTFGFASGEARLFCQPISPHFFKPCVGNKVPADQGSGLRPSPSRLSSILFGSVTICIQSGCIGSPFSLASSVANRLTYVVVRPASLPARQRGCWNAEGLTT
jgi:hypothetical protein